MYKRQTPIRTFRKIILPQAGPVIAAGTLIVFLYTISDFGAVQLMRYDTLTRSIFTAQLANQSVALALSLILLLLAGVIVLSERIFSRVTFKTDQALMGKPLEYELGKWKIPAFIFTIFVSLLSIGAPLLAIGDWASDGIFRSTVGGRPLTIDREQVWESAWNTLSILSLIHI